MKRPGNQLQTLNCMTHESIKSINLRKSPTNHIVMIESFTLCFSSVYHGDLGMPIPICSLFQCPDQEMAIVPCENDLSFLYKHVIGALHSWVSKAAELSDKGCLQPGVRSCGASCSWDLGTLSVHVQKI